MGENTLEGGRTLLDDHRLRGEHFWGEHGLRGNSGGRTLGEDRTFGVYTFERSILGGHGLREGHVGENTL